MSPESIPYAAKVNAACWLIRKARKIAMELPDTTREQRQAIELEIVDIGMRMYSETREEPQPEVTHDPGKDHELEAYIAAVRELVPGAERWFVANDYHHKFTIAQSAQRWRNHVSYSKGRAQQWHRERAGIVGGGIGIQGLSMQTMLVNVAGTLLHHQQGMTMHDGLLRGRRIFAANGQTKTSRPNRRPSVSWCGGLRWRL